MLLDLHQDARKTPAYGLDGAVEHSLFVAFDIDLDEAHGATVDAVEQVRPHLNGPVHGIGRCQ